MDELENETTLTDAALSRRRLLQAAAATGAAAAVWSAPRIVAADHTPGNGAVCTVAPLTYTDNGKKNFDNAASCTLNGVSYMTFGDPFPGSTFSIVFNPSHIPGADDGCTAPPGASYTIQFAKGAGPGSGYTCYIGKFRVYNQSNGKSLWIEGDTDGTTPSILKTDNDAQLGNEGSYFYGDITVECCPTANFH